LYARTFEDLGKEGNHAGVETQEANELYSLKKKGTRIKRYFLMGRNAGKYVDVEIFDSDQVADLTPFPNWVALIFSIIFCFLLFLAIWQT